MTTDPIELLRELRADVPESTADARAAARLKSTGTGGHSRGPQSRRRRRYVLGVGAAVTACLLLVVTIGLPGTSGDEADAAAVARLVDVAKNQRQLNAKGRNLYVLSRFNTRATWTLGITQARLDELTKNAVAIVDARNAHPPSSVPSKRRTASQRRRDERLVARLQKRSDDRVRAGVRASDLRVSAVTVTSTLPVVAWQNDRGVGASGGQRGGSTTYGSDAEKRAARILGRARIGGNGGGPMDFAGFEYAAQPLSFALKAAEVKSLSADPATLRRQLAQNPSRRAKMDDNFERGAPLEVFRAAASVLASPYAAPGVRAAALKVAAETPGVSVNTEAKDSRGRAGLGLTIAIKGGSQTVILDSSDSRVLGMNLDITEPAKFQGRVTFTGGLRIIPQYDSGSIAISYDRSIVTRGEPVCPVFTGGPRGYTFCKKGIREVRNP